MARLNDPLEPIRRGFGELRRLLDGEDAADSMAPPTAYIASKVVRAPALRELARLLEVGGLCRVTASWLNAGEILDEAARRRLWRFCVEEAAEADLVLLLVDEADTLKGCLIECGAALAAGKPVFQIGTCASLRAGDGSDASFTGHALWFQARDVEDALRRWRGHVADMEAGR